MPPQSPLFMRGPNEPLRIERAEGPWLYTSDGHKILDAGAGAVVVNIGQGRREIAEVAARTISKLDYIVPVWTSAERERLAERLTGWTPPGLSRFFFTSGGSESVEAALKFSILYNKARGKQSKSKVIGRRFSYHGNTIAALSAGGSGRRADYEHVLLDCPKIDPSYCYRCPWGKTYPSCDLDCATALEKEILNRVRSLLEDFFFDRARKRNPQARTGLDCGLHCGADDGLERRCRASRQGVLAQDSRDLHALRR